MSRDNSTGEQLGRIFGAICRRMRQLPGPREVEHSLIRRARRRHRKTAEPGWRNILADLERHGLHRTTLDLVQLAGLLRSPWLDTRRLQRLGIGVGRAAASADRASQQSFVAQQLYLAGLEAPLLRMAECFLGLTPLYLGAELKREQADGELRGVRRWHRDVEDRQILKILLYLSDVGIGDGPFEYLRDDASTRLAAHLGYRSGFVKVEEHADACGEPSVACHGPAGTILVFDGARLFHRAQPPTHSPRLSVTFTYVTRFRWQIFPGQRPPRSLRREIRAASPELMAYLP